jgi:transcriptional regulator GlxA family with amidase domain
MRTKSWYVMTIIGTLLASMIVKGELVGIWAVGQSAKGNRDLAVHHESPRLPIPPSGIINVAFVITDGATMIDFAGPWEVFQDAMFRSDGSAYRSERGMPEKMEDMHMPFRLYTVSDSTTPVTASGGMKIVPDYTFDNVPTPQVVVVPAQSGRSEALKQWLIKTAPTTDVTMSVCTGAGVLAFAGLLDGQRAATHHWYVDELQRKYPKVRFQTGVRYVEGNKVSTSAGLTSGMDLALHVVERYLGRDIAEATVEYMEYEGKEQNPGH